MARKHTLIGIGLIILIGIGLFILSLKLRRFGLGPFEPEVSLTESNVEVRLNRLIYALEDVISVTVHAHGGALSEDTLGVLVVAPESDDLEVLSLVRSELAGVHQTDKPLPLEAFSAQRPVQQLDGVLTLKPNETLFALYVPDRGIEDPDLIGYADFIGDFGLLEDTEIARTAKPEVIPELAMSDDEIEPPSGSKPVGTLLRPGGLPVQVAVEELVIYPKSRQELDRFLTENGGEVLLTDLPVDELRLGRGIARSEPDAYLVHVDRARADVERLPQMRALFGEAEPLMASNSAALEIYALALQWRLEGMAVGVNPRLQYASAPLIYDRVGDVHGASLFDMPKVWAFAALWDADALDGVTVPVAFLDQGFAPNPDFRGYPDFRECDFDSGTIVEAAVDVPCGPGVATGPPTVGNSFFGSRSWHGNGVVTAAGGVINGFWNHRYKANKGVYADCDNNGVDDAVDIAAGTLADAAPANGVPDVCDARDCDGNGVADAVDIAEGRLRDDAPANGFPDIDNCDPYDCNHNGIDDGYEITSGRSPDCNDNWHPDDCDVDPRSVADRNADGIPDECQYGAPGTGGLVVTPMLYRFGLSSYAFEMGLGIRQAVLDGASVINLSASYPCRIIDQVGVEFSICDPAGRAALCSAATGLAAQAGAAACGAAGLLDLFLPGASLIGCASSTITLTAGTVGCFSSLFAGDLKGPIASAVEFASARGVPVVNSAGNHFELETLPPVIRDIIDLDEIDPERWDMIPCVIPGVICVGAADLCDTLLSMPDVDGDGDIDQDDCPGACCSPGWSQIGCCYPNAEFAGPRVNIWAPIPSYYSSPSTTAAVAPPEEQIYEPINGTSGAAPYISGLIAMLQAFDPTLDPNTPGLDPSERESIPRRLADLLESTAHTRVQVDEAAEAGGGRADPSGVRRNLVNPMAAVEAAAFAAIPDFRERDYDGNLNFDEDPDPSGDSVVTELTASGFKGTIYPHTDKDRFHTRTSAAAGLHRVRVVLTYPRDFGDLVLDSLLTLEGHEAPPPAPDEYVLRYETPPLFPDTDVVFDVRSPRFTHHDNVYKLSQHPDVLVGPQPAADRFDRDDPAVNPPESRPNNDVIEHAVHLGAGDGEFTWVPRASGPLERYAIEISDLNIHRRDDVDWFSLVTLTPFRSEESTGCQPQLEIRFAPELVLTAVDRDGTVLIDGLPSPVEVPAALLTTPFRFSLRPRVPGTFAEYSLVLDLIITPPRICELAKILPLIEELVAARNRISFPAFFPDAKDLRLPTGPYVGPNRGPIANPNRWPVAEQKRGFDKHGRVTTPDFYLVHWPGGEGLRLFAELPTGRSIALALSSREQGLISAAATPDVALSYGLTAGTGEFGSDIVALEVPSSLAAGDYILSVSLGTLNTPVDIHLPWLDVDKH